MYTEILDNYLHWVSFFFFPFRLIWGIHLGVGAGNHPLARSFTN